MSSNTILNIISQCGLGAVTVDGNYIVTGANEKAYELLKEAYTGELIGKNFLEMVPDLCDEEHPKRYCYISFNNYLRMCPVPKIPDLPEGHRAFVFRNATAEVQKDRYENVLEQIGDSIIMCDEHLKISFLNNAAVKMDGLVLDNVLGESIEEVYEALDGQGLIIPRSIKERQVFLERRQYYTTKFGKNIDITANTFPIVQHRQILGGYSVMKDWSAVDSLSKRIVELQEKLLQQTSGKTSEKHALSAKYNFNDIIHISDSIEQVISKCRQAAKSDSSVLICGETGTGKELFAQSIHNASKRANGPFLAINCAAIPENLLESLLFGTEKGAYTGAEQRKGYFEQANNGTLLLDELNSMNINLQAKLLRVLQDGSLRHVGGSTEIKVNVRVISNMNISPQEAIEKNLLRQDLFYRLGVVNINIPPLRRRTDDIPLLSKHFIMRCNGKLSRNVRNIDEETLELFKNYNWPGNVRELEHVIEHAMNILPDDKSIITAKYIPDYILEKIPQSNPKKTSVTMSGTTSSIAQTIKNLEKEQICEVLIQNNKNISQTARVLNMSRQSLQYRIKKYNIDITQL